MDARCKRIRMYAFADVNVYVVWNTGYRDSLLEVFGTALRLLVYFGKYVLFFVSIDLLAILGKNLKRTLL